jgi:hypothetical protein
MKLQLRYDGRYDVSMGGDLRSWTVVSHFMFHGRDMYKATFTGSGAIKVLLMGEQI